MISRQQQILLTFAWKLHRWYFCMIRKHRIYLKPTRVSIYTVADLTFKDTDKISCGRLRSSATVAWTSAALEQEPSQWRRRLLEWQKDGFMQPYRNNWPPNGTTSIFTEAAFSEKTAWCRAYKILYWHGKKWETFCINRTKVASCCKMSEVDLGKAGCPACSLLQFS